MSSANIAISYTPSETRIFYLYFCVETNHLGHRKIKDWWSSFSGVRGGSGGQEFLKIIFYRRIGMKKESMEQLNALKSCPFNPGAIWSEQQVMSMVKIHVPVFIIR